MNKRKTLILDRAEFLRHCLDLRPELRDEPEFGIVVSLIAVRDVLQLNDRHHIPRTVLFETVAELIPSQREFWLRCEATDNERFIGGMTFLMSESPANPKASEQP
jgi:hypothetical protein